jgi:hypothetical protein
MDKKGDKINEQLPGVLNSLRWLVMGVGLVVVFILVGGSYALLFKKNQVAYVEQSANDTDWEEEDYEIENGREIGTGLLVDKNWTLIKRHCTQCHTTKIITQNRASREGWASMILWMQETQNLWDLGEDLEGVLDYLARNYGVADEGFSSEMIIQEWYEIE